MMKKLATIINSSNFKLTWEFKLADFWIGFYFKTTLPLKIDIWFCIIPCFPLHFVIRNYNG